MKKLFLILPILALAGFTTYFVTVPKITPTAAIIQESNAEALFLACEHDLRQIIRHGDEKAVIGLRQSLASIESKIKEQKRNGYTVDKLQNDLQTYQEDSLNIAQAFTPILKKIRQYDQYERDHKESFQISLEQIGLYELKTAYSTLETLRLNYLKDPTEEKIAQYTVQSQHVKQLIDELYLDSALDKPLYHYINNHKSYLDTIAQGYTAVQYNRINRLRINGYAIKTELQILPHS